LKLPTPLNPLRMPRPRYSNHAHNAKNYAESFWIFDWAFGTLSPLVGKPQGRASKQA
jgi:sterol desaturase/sphingolipid hydroxylase (fatty acid hydroxylase superfamily)